MDLNVTAFDYYNQEFEQDQYKYMSFNTEIESLGIKNQVDLKIEPS